MASLRDADDGIVALALGAVADSGLPEALPLVAGIAASAGRDSSIRVQAVRVLARVRTPATAHTLVSLTTARRRWLGRPLAPKSPEVLAAIEALATHWREEPQVATLLRHASRHHDAEIRNAARGAGA